MDKLKNSAILLDVDGVLNTEHTELHKKEVYLKTHSKIPTIEEEMVAILAEILQKSNSMLVMSASMRHSYYDYAVNNNELVSINEVELSRLLTKYRVKIDDYTPDLSYIGKSRGAEITQWLKNHTEITKFCILDDKYSQITKTMT